MKQLKFTPSRHLRQQITGLVRDGALSRYVYTGDGAIEQRVGLCARHQAVDFGSVKLAASPFAPLGSESSDACEPLVDRDAVYRALDLQLPDRASRAAVAFCG